MLGMNSKIANVDKDGLIDMEVFADFVDITKVKYYRFKDLKNGTLELKFYDAKRKLIKMKAEK